MAKQFASGITIQTENKTADAKSILQLLTLGISQGASVTVTTQGPDGEEALNMLCNFIETGLGEQ
jgi:phosphotransferase system HPr (HPr) family protein